MVSNRPSPCCRCCLIEYPPTSATINSHSFTLSSQLQPLSTPRQSQARNVIPQFLNFSVYPLNRLTPGAEVSHFSHGNQEVLDGMFSVSCTVLGQKYFQKLIVGGNRTTSPHNFDRYRVTKNE